MRLVKNIKNIVEALKNPLTWNRYDFELLKTEFFNEINNWPVEKFPSKKSDCKSEYELKKLNEYNEYDKAIFKNLKLQFLKVLWNEWLNYCCYCGKNELIILEQAKKRLFDIEHFLPRILYPNLSVNILNWLPVCSSCNTRLKWSKNPLKNKLEIFHPYFWFINVEEKRTLDEKYTFSPVDKRNRKLIYESNHSIFFHIQDIYDSSKSTKNVLNEISCIESKINTDKNNAKQYWIPFNFEKRKKSEWYNFPSSEEEILKFENWKLKKDLLDNLEE